MLDGKVCIFKKRKRGTESQLQQVRIRPLGSDDRPQQVLFEAVLEQGDCLAYRQPLQLIDFVIGDERRLLVDLHIPKQDDLDLLPNQIAEATGTVVQHDVDPRFFFDFAQRGFRPGLACFHLSFGKRPVIVTRPMNERDFGAVGRLAPGSSDEAAEVETTLLHRRGRAEDSSYDPNAQITLAPIQLALGPLASGESVIARWLGGVAVIVLLIAAANIANLLLSRGLRRRREVAVRLALGISRSRLIGFVTAEGLILAFSGGVAALVVAEWGGRLITSLLLEDVYFSQVVTGRVVLFTLAVASLAALLSTLLPALQASRPDLVQDLRSGNPGEAPTSARVRKGLLVVQVAFSVVLIVGAGLFVRSLSAVAQLDLGVEPGVIRAKLGPQVAEENLGRDRPESVTFKIFVKESVPHVAAVMFFEKSQEQGALVIHHTGYGVRVATQDETGFGGENMAKLVCPDVGV